MSDSVHPVLINGQWRSSTGTLTFRASNPQTRSPLEDQYPVSPWNEIEETLQAAHQAARELEQIPPSQIAKFLNEYADRIEDSEDDLISTANRETALPEEPRLRSVELPRTTSQLRSAADATRDASWSQSTIDTSLHTRSIYRAIGPVCVFGPNNFPFAFNSIAGGDFAAAIAAGNPVIAKGNTSHPGTTKIFAEAANEAANSTEMPKGLVQLLYRTDHQDGERLVSHPLLGATGYTGSRQTGLTLKSAADCSGKPIYLELSSINPILVLPGALKERQDEIIDDLSSAILLGTGQFCTSPGLIIVIESSVADIFVSELGLRLRKTPPGVLLGAGVQKSLIAGIRALETAGAKTITGGLAIDDPNKGFCIQNTLLQVDGASFLMRPKDFQTETFGNSSLVVRTRDVEELKAVVGSLEGNLTGSIYSHSQEIDNSLYNEVESLLRPKVGRLLNDKMPTGVAVSPAMNHGGPFPATGHPGFTAVGIPASLLRFAALQCYDNVRQHRLPLELQDKNPTGHTWRLVDGTWTQSDI